MPSISPLLLTPGHHCRIRPLLPLPLLPALSATQWPSPTSAKAAPIISALRFCTARWDFFQYNRAPSPSGHFIVFIGKNPVVDLSGLNGRQVSPRAEIWASLREWVSFRNPHEYAQPGGYFVRRIMRTFKAENISNCRFLLFANTASRCS